MDLLKRFEERNRFVEGEKVDEQDVELSLGLSSNGRFGAERPRPRGVVDGGSDDNNNNDNNRNGDGNLGLIRASSVSDLWNCWPETEDRVSLRLSSPITRTCSLPTQTEVELRKRKELQSLRRSEAKRKRVEKLKNGRGVKELLPEDNELRQSSPSSSLLPPLPRPASAGSPASGGSSGVSDLESQPFSGYNKDYEPNRTASTSLCRSNSTASQTSSQTIINGNRSNETLKKLFADMPCVSTKGVNGKKIQGFLYRYSKDEEVRIVCVCHGSFLTPAEFVKHGGGGDVEHPLRHIVVMPPSL